MGSEGDGGREEGEREAVSTAQYPHIEYTCIHNCIIHEYAGGMEGGGGEGGREGGREGGGDGGRGGERKDVSTVQP